LFLGEDFGTVVSEVSARYHQDRLAFEGVGDCLPQVERNVNPLLGDCYRQQVRDIIRPDTLEKGKLHFYAMFGAMCGFIQCANAASRG
jgi:hypothetical protein